MSDRPIALLKCRSKLQTENDGPYAQHTGQFAAPTVDQNGNLWVVLAVGDGSGAGNDPFSLEVAYDANESYPNFTLPGSIEGPLAVVNHPYLSNGGANWIKWGN